MYRKPLTPDQVREITDILEDTHQRLMEIDGLTGMMMLVVMGAVNTEVAPSPVSGGLDRLQEVLRQFSISELKIMNDFEKELLSPFTKDDDNADKFFKGLFGCQSS